MGANFPAVPIHHLLGLPSSFLPFFALSLPMIYHSFGLRPPRTTDRSDSSSSPLSHMFRMLTRWALFIAGFMASAASAKEVEFKHHNNTELAETLQKVHNR